MFLMIKRAGQVGHLSKDAREDTAVRILVLDLQVEAVFAAYPQEGQIRGGKFV